MHRCWATLFCHLQIIVNAFLVLARWKETRRSKTHLNLQWTNYLSYRNTPIKKYWLYSQASRIATQVISSRLYQSWKKLRLDATWYVSPLQSTCCNSLLRKRRGFSVWPRMLTTSTINFRRLSFQAQVASKSTTRHTRSKLDSRRGSSVSFREFARVTAYHEIAFTFAATVRQSAVTWTLRAESAKATWFHQSNL